MCAGPQTQLKRHFRRLATDYYGVVLSDNSMFGLSGLELLGHIGQRFSDTPVIIISGISDHEHSQGLIKLGAFNFCLNRSSSMTLRKAFREQLSFAGVGSRQMRKAVSLTTGKLLKGVFKVDRLGDYAATPDTCWPAGFIFL